MDILTERIIAARAAYSDAAQELKSAQEDAALTEAALYLSTDYKALGSNETDRKAQFAALVRNDAHCERAAITLRTAERRKAHAADALAAAEDARRSYENALRSAWLTAQFGVTVNPADFIHDFKF